MESALGIQSPQRQTHAVELCSLHQSSQSESRLHSSWSTGRTASARTTGSSASNPVLGSGCAKGAAADKDKTTSARMHAVVKKRRSRDGLQGALQSMLPCRRDAPRRSRRSSRHLSTLQTSVCFGLIHSKNASSTCAKQARVWQPRRDTQLSSAATTETAALWTRPTSRSLWSTSITRSRSLCMFPPQLPQATGVLDFSADASARMASQSELCTLA